MYEIELLQIIDESFFSFFTLVPFSRIFLLFPRHHSVHFRPENGRSTTLNFRPRTAIQSLGLLFADKVEFSFSLFLRGNLVLLFIGIWTWGGVFSLVIENAAHHLHLILFLLEAETKSNLSRFFLHKILMDRCLKFTQNWSKICEKWPSKIDLKMRLFCGIFRLA